MDIPLFKARPDLLRRPPTVVTNSDGYSMLRFEARERTDKRTGTYYPRVVFYVLCQSPGIFMYGYSYHYEGGLTEQWYGPHGDPGRDAHRPDALPFYET